MHPVLEAHIENKKFSHAYLMLGDVGLSRQWAFECAAAILNHNAEKLESHPDFSYAKTASFGINNSRELIRRASETSFSGNGKVFIIEANSFTPEAGNALLKTIEEPFSGTHFFIITLSKSNILPTLLSRLAVIDNMILRTEMAKDREELLKKFFSSSPPKRMALLKSMEKDREKAMEFLNLLEIFLRKKSAIEAMADLPKARRAILTPGAYPKMILEYLALTMPKIV